MTSASSGRTPLFGRREIFEDPLRGAGEIRHRVVFPEVPVEEIADIGLEPVAVFGSAGLVTGKQLVETALVSSLPHRDLCETGVGIFARAARLRWRARRRNSRRGRAHHRY